MVDKGNVISQYTYGEKGSFLLENKFIEEFFLDPKTKEPVKANAIIFKDENKAFDFFMLGARSDKEFSYNRVKNQENNKCVSFVGTSYSHNREFIGPNLSFKLLKYNENYILIESWHSHPGHYNPKTTYPAYPSGFYPNGNFDYTYPMNDRKSYELFKSKFSDRIPDYFNILLSNGTITIKYNDREFIKN